MKIKRKFIDYANSSYPNYKWCEKIVPLADVEMSVKITKIGCVLLRFAQERQKKLWAMLKKKNQFEKTKEMLDLCNSLSDIITYLLEQNTEGVKCIEFIPSTVCNVCLCRWKSGTAKSTLGTDTRSVCGHWMKDHLNQKEGHVQNKADGTKYLAFSSHYPVAKVIEL